MPTNIAQEIGKYFVSGGWSNILKFGLQIGVTLAFGTILYAGFLYLTGADNASKQKDAIDWIKAAALGLAILIFGYLILNTINPDILNQTLITTKQKQDTIIQPLTTPSFEFPNITPTPIAP